MAVPVRDIHRGGAEAAEFSEGTEEITGSCSLPSPGGPCRPVAPGRPW